MRRSLSSDQAVSENEGKLVKPGREGVSMNLRRSHEPESRGGSGRLMVMAMALVWGASLASGWGEERAWGQVRSGGEPALERLPLPGVASRPLRVELGGPRPQGVASLGSPSLPPPRRFAPLSAAASAGGMVSPAARGAARAAMNAGPRASTSRVLVGPRGGGASSAAAMSGVGAESVSAGANPAAGEATTSASSLASPAAAGALGAPGIDPMWVVAPFGGNLPTATYLWTQRQHAAQRQAYHNRYGTAAAMGGSARPPAIPASRAFRNGAPGRFDRPTGYFDTIGGRR